MKGIIMTIVIVGAIFFAVNYIVKLVRTRNKAKIGDVRDTLEIKRDFKDELKD